MPDKPSTITAEELLTAFTRFALALAREALLTSEERTQKAEAIAAFVRAQLTVIDQAARQWPACTPALPSLEEARAGLSPPDRTCQQCACWRQYYEAWKRTGAPAWWPNADQASREELEAWAAQRQRGRHVAAKP